MRGPSWNMNQSTINFGKRDVSAPLIIFNQKANSHIYHNFLTPSIWLINPKATPHDKNERFQLIVEAQVGSDTSEPRTHTPVPVGPTTTLCLILLSPELFIICIFSGVTSKLFFPSVWGHVSNHNLSGPQQCFLHWTQSRHWIIKTNKSYFDVNLSISLEK